MGKRISAKVKNYAKQQQFKQKMKRVFDEYERHKLKTNAGKMVRSRKQAIAIALSEARRKIKK